MESIVYCGTWDVSGRGELGLYRFEPETGAVRLVEILRDDIAAGMMLYRAESRALYVLDECEGRGAVIGGRIFAFRADPMSGALTELGHLPSFGTNPAYITEDGAGNGLIVCNHSAATSVVRAVGGDGHCEMQRTCSDTTIVHYPIRADGSLGEPDDILITPPENGVYSCIHCIRLARDGKTLIACDRNLDKIYRLHFDESAARLIIDDVLELRSFARPEHLGIAGATVRSAVAISPEAKSPAAAMAKKRGVGPRYAAFHPTRPLVYVNSEYITELRVIDYAQEQLRLVQTCDSTLSPFAGQTASQSDLLVAPDGKTLYMLYRKINAVGVFRLDGSGIPCEIQALPLSGRGPRSCCISPDGRHFLIANLESADITTCEIRGDGTLTELCRIPTTQHRPGKLLFL